MIFESIDQKKKKNHDSGIYPRILTGFFIPLIKYIFIKSIIRLLDKQTAIGLIYYLYFDLKHSFINQIRIVKDIS